VFAPKALSKCKALGNAQWNRGSGRARQSVRAVVLIEGGAQRTAPRYQLPTASADM